MAGEWQTVSFRDAFSINPSIGLEVGAAYPFVEMADISPGTRDVLATQSREYTGGGSKFSAGDTLLARITPCLENGKICRYSGRSGAVAHGSTEFIVVRGRNDITDDAFAYYTTSSQEFRAFAISQMTGSSGRQRVPTESLRNWFVRLPPLREQKRIAHILGTLDDKIELNHRMNATLEGISRAIFKSWFVDFDPVRQKAAGKQPVGMEAQTAALFPDSFEDSEIGEVPTGWSIARLGDVAEHLRRASRPGEIPNGTPYIGLEHMPRRCIALADWGEGDGVESNKFEFQQGEILFGKLRPYFHKVGVAPVDGVCSTDIVVARPTRPKWFGVVLGVMSSDEFVAYTNAGSTGTKMPRTNWEDMSRYEVALPPANVAEAFTTFVRAAVESITARIHHSRTLAALRDTLLPKLLSGELRVPEAEGIVENAVG